MQRITEDHMQGEERIDYDKFVKEMDIIRVYKRIYRINSGIKEATGGWSVEQISNS